MDLTDLKNSLLEVMVTTNETQLATITAQDKEITRLNARVNDMDNLLFKSAERTSKALERFNSKYQDNVAELDRQIWQNHQGNGKLNDI